MNTDFIEQNFCDAEISALLKEVGFNEPPFGHWHPDGRFLALGEFTPIGSVAAPLFQQCIIWLRTKGIRIVEHIRPSTIEYWVFIDTVKDGWENADAFPLDKAIKHAISFLKSNQSKQQ